MAKTNQTKINFIVIFIWANVAACGKTFNKHVLRAIERFRNYVTNYLFRREICSAGTYFTEDLFLRNFLNEKLVPGTYFIGKCIPPM